MASIQEELSKLQSLKISPKQILEIYEHIELTEDEMIEALIWAKQRKEEKERMRIAEEREKRNRELAAFRFKFDTFRQYMITRAGEIFKFEFIIDDGNEPYFNLMAHYFIDDEEGFIAAAKKLDVKNPSIKKGIMFAGNVGVGKTVLLNLFRKNQKQVYYVRHAKDVAKAYLDNEGEQYESLFPLAKNDPATFYQQYAGLALDDIGSEGVKNKYGNKSNVIGDLIESRYASGFFGPYLHASTNLSVKDLEEFYGLRVVDRMREMFNFIVWSDKTRRK